MTSQRDDRPIAQSTAIGNLRAELADGFSFVRSREVTNAIASISFEEILSTAVSNIENDDSDIRPGRLASLRSMKTKLVDAVEQARQLPADAFTYRRGQGAANTSGDGSGPSEGIND